MRNHRSLATRSRLTRSPRLRASRAEPNQFDSRAASDSSLGPLMGESSTTHRLSPASIAANDTGGGVTGKPASADRYGSPPKKRGWASGTVLTDTGPVSSPAHAPPPHNQSAEMRRSRRCSRAALPGCAVKPHLDLGSQPAKLARRRARAAHGRYQHPANAPDRRWRREWRTRRSAGSHGRPHHVARTPVRRRA